METKKIKHKERTRVCCPKCKGFLFEVVPYLSLLKRQDSVFTMLNIKLSDFELKLDHYLKTKDKEVKVKGFSFGASAYIIAGLVLLVVAGFLKFRPKIF